MVGTRDEEALKRMLHESKLTLQKAVDICRACESASANSAAILGEPASVTRVSAYRRSRAYPRSDNARRDDPCRSCGRTRHADGVRCPAMDASCHVCGGSGHFAAACATGRPITAPAAAVATGRMPGHVTTRPATGRPAAAGRGCAAGGARGLAQRQRARARPEIDQEFDKSSEISMWTS